jgi:hypothetical protein
VGVFTREGEEARGENKTNTNGPEGVIISRQQHSILHKHPGRQTHHRPSSAAAQLSMRNLLSTPSAVLSLTHPKHTRAHLNNFFSEFPP